MKKQIWKFEIQIRDVVRVLMPEGAEILTFQNQRGNPCIWALVDPTKPKEERMFEIYGTGHDIHEDMGIDREYIGTIISEQGMLVWHLFERAL